jgi:hypothetical protein
MSGSEGTGLDVGWLGDCSVDFGVFLDVCRRFKVSFRFSPRDLVLGVPFGLLEFSVMAIETLALLLLMLPTRTLNIKKSDPM